MIHSGGGVEVGLCLEILAPRGRPDYRAIALVDWIERADEDRL